MNNIDIQSSKRLISLFAFYCALLLISAMDIIIIAKYNYAISIAFFVVSIIAFPLKKTFSDCFFICIFFLLILLYTQMNILYMVCDVIVVSTVLHLLNIAECKETITQPQIVFLRNVFIFYIACNVIVSFFPHYQSEMSGRFVGLLQGTNISATVCSLLLIFILEANKSLRCHLRFSFLVVLSTFLYFLFVMQSRSLLFTIPYFFYQGYLLFGSKKGYYFILIFSVILLFAYYWSQITLLLRIESDSSYNTRLEIYSQFLDKLKENYFLIPVGFNQATSFIRDTVGVKNYSVHNDFLRYIYDWGMVFYAIVIVLYKKLIRMLNLNTLLIFFTVISGSFHNIFFLCHIWIPFILILIVCKQKNNSLNKSCIKYTLYLYDKK